ncbi:unnamed protein product [Medioppia subpectinata]|uniref:DUF8206 domain-containing protein n=1 Tax=Medioppia subpectinata TaxID=1979941 RepID=A0A7R9KEL6_9ACAR|nr:unnamed protein product [Medioppia subpectinata]CAG2102115.1 unnamed protein product [Medioppia subpectinata]
MAISIYCSYGSSFAITSDGHVFSWGDNRGHELGHNITDYKIFKPQLISNLNDPIKIHRPWIRTNAMYSGHYELEAQGNSEHIPKQKKEITIVLLGQLGVGKSTFINAFVNYMSFESMDAADGQPICLIPANFTICYPQTRRPVNITFGEPDINENSDDPAQSATQYPKCYKFQNDNFVLNIIDTPGIADTDGVERDNENMQNILDFISNYREINAFCVLLKPNNARVDSFRYLVASVPPNNIQSVEECQRFFDYIKQLPAHKVMDTLSVNETKQIIQLLTKPLADITKNIADNINQCQRHSVEINEFSGTIEELRNKLYIPSVEIITKPLDRPMTVCGDGRCCKRQTINDITEINYNTQCHTPCYLDFNDGNIVGNKGFLRCKAFNRYSGTDRDHVKSKQLISRSLSDTIRSKITESTNCKECGHNYQTHLYLTYEIESKITKVTDIGIVSAQSAAEGKVLQIQSLDQRIADLNAENETIVKSMSKFTCFLKNNALTTVNDAFGDYVRHLIANENHGSFCADSQTQTSRLEQLLDDYKYEKQLISNYMQNSNGSNNITAQIINDCVEKLCKLKYKGPDIRNMLEIQRRLKSQHHLSHNEIEYRPPTNSGVQKFLNATKPS